MNELISRCEENQAATLFSCYRGYLMVPTVQMWGFTTSIYSEPNNFMVKLDKKRYPNMSLKVK